MANGNEREAFDQSFDFFEKHGGIEDAKDLWSQPETKWAAHASTSTPTHNNSFDADPFQFSAISSTLQPSELDTPSHLFPEDPFQPKEIQKGLATVRVAILEQLSALYDNVATEGSVCVEGSIYVKPLAKMTTPFCLVLRDLLEHIERAEERADVCQVVTDKGGRKGLHRTDRVLRVTEATSESEEVAILHYVCVPSLHPVPLLVKSRVRQSREYTRVGFKIRANPSNEFPLTRIIIMLAVPLSMEGQSVRMSKQGGLWDEMKRTISWSVKKLDPGEALEIQAQFLARDGGVAHASDRSPMFPVLVRCDYPKIFSSVEMLSDYVDSHSVPVRIRLSATSRILHRKV